jgi:hypothetical protein
MAAPAAPERGHGDAGWSSAFAGVLTDLSNLWDGVVSHFTAASQGTTTDPVSTGTQVGTGFDPDGLTALPPDGGGDVGTGFDPDG